MSVYPSRDIEREAAAALAVVSQHPEAAAAAAAEGGAACPDAAAPTRPAGAVVAAVEPGSPADDAGFEPGCVVTMVEGEPLRDLIDWRWHACDAVVELGYVDLDGDEGCVELERDPGEDWGLAFEGVVFDGVRQCRNACTFCFMRQLPAGLRLSLSLRDDDFRLSFLAGTFVTLTNLSAADEARIVEQRISPLRVSLHAADASVRARLIGRHAAHGLAALDRLLAAGIEVDAQVVLVPGVNDGEVLRQTLSWAYERPGILNVGVVPLGYTRHQRAFDRSFDEPEAARAVLEVLAPFQRRAQVERGTAWAFAADEFYCNAFGAAVLDHLPPASHYGAFELFEDGIGIVRSAVDDLRAAMANGTAARTADALAAAGMRVRLVCGEAMAPYFGPLLEEGPLGGLVEPLVVGNAFFGGNVDVTGLLAGCDVAAAIRADREGPSGSAGKGTGPGPFAAEGEHPPGPGDAGSPSAAGATPSPMLGTGRSEGPLPPPADRAPRTLYAIFDVMLNDDGLTLDGMGLAALEAAAGCPVAVVPCTPSDYLNRIAALCA